MSYNAKNIDNIIKTNAIKNKNEEVIMEFTDTGDDKGVIVKGGQLSVGTPDQGRESVFGQGDSVQVEIGFHYDATNQTGNIITGATDITDALRSDTGSTVQMFASNLAEQCIMIGMSTAPAGVKSKWDSLGTLEPDRLVGEYYRNDDIWTQSTYMVTDANFPYTKYTWNIASTFSEQLRFGLSILNPNLDFELKTLNINGTDYTKYWVRLRLITPVTALPVLEQVKAHTNRTEINEDGVVEFFGFARGLKNVEVLETANNASDPVDQNVTYFTGGLNGGVSKLVDNRFRFNNQLDSKMFLMKIDENVDTSTDIVLSIPFYVNGISTGDIEFTIEYVQITSDFQYTTLATPDGSFNVIYPIITPSSQERQILRVEIPVNEIDPDVGGVMVVVSRDARNTNPEDTLSSDIVLTGSTGDGRRWRL